MSKYFIDVEFLEGTQKTWFGHTKPTIDLISIGIVAEDGREYYAISKDFNLKEAWNRYDEKINEDYKPSYMGFLDGSHNPQFIKTYWLRDNVLKPIYNELVLHHTSADWYHKNPHLGEKVNDGRWLEFNYKSLKWLINKYGKTNKQIAEEVYEFCSNDYHKGNNLTFNQRKEYPLYDNFKPQFYGYYSNYDWVVFCWLFGRMIDLPKGFPMYCIDLKQELDRIQEIKFGLNLYKGSLANDIKTLPNYPKQTNEHNSLSDAIFCRDLHKFLNNLI